MPFYRASKLLFMLFLLVFVSFSLYGENANELLSKGVTAPVNSLLDAMTNESKSFPVVGKWNIVFFWSLFCHSCLEELPKIQEGLPPSTDYNIYYVSLDSVRMQTGLNNFAKRRKIVHPILMERIGEGKYEVADQWGVSATPTVFVINPEGTIRYSHFGPMDIQAFAADFKTMLLTGKEVE